MLGPVRAGRELTGRLTDGWAAPIPSYLLYERWAAANATIDHAGSEAGRPATRVGDARRPTGRDDLVAHPRFGEEVVPAVLERLSLPRAVRPR